jgi:hypothetical protein
MISQVNKKSFLFYVLNIFFNLTLGFFIIELILGFNGKLFNYGNLSIRKLLFILVLIILSIKAIYLSKKYGYKIFSLKKGVSLVRQYDSFDFFVGLFLILNSIWIFIVPSTMGYGIRMAVKHAMSLSMLLLYFPVTLLLKFKNINIKSIHNIVMASVCILAIIHIYLYVGEKACNDATFALNFFEFIKKLTFGSFQRPMIMYPRNYIKIIYTTSIFLVVIFYYVLTEELTPKLILFYVIGLSALLTTLTKSLWYGVLCGIAIYIFIRLYFIKKHVYTLNFKQFNILLFTAIITVCLLNSLLLENYVFIRLGNTFARKEESQQHSYSVILNEDGRLNENTKFIDELAGTERANYTRIEQTKALIDKWSKSPWFGFGYGSYADEYFRSNTATPYSYEMLLPSMLVHIGLVGVLIWLAFIIYIILTILQQARKHKEYCI